MSAFIFLVIIGGSNAVAVRFSNQELPPFWGAATRFAVTAILFWIIVAARNIALPRGRALAGSLLYGILSVGASYAFLYWGLLTVQAGLAMVVLAFVPLMAFFFAILHGLERFRWQGLAGTFIAISGILIGIGGSLNASPADMLSLLAVVAGAACLAEGAVVFKLFPKTHPVATNALAVSVGALMLFVVSMVAGEEWNLPAEADTVLAFIYLVCIGSVLLFYLYLYVLSRWTASATTYSFLLFPIATVIIAAWLAGEVVTGAFIIGSLFVLAGVWLGAVRSSTPDPNA